MTGFAEGTTVPVAKTRGEIETLVQRYGAEQFSSGWMGTRAAIGFVCHGRMVRFVLDLPADDWAKETLWKKKRTGWWNKDQIPAEAIRKRREEEERRRWRCLLLAIKAKLEVVKTGISTFDEEFLAHIVTAENMTIYERLKTFEANGKKLLPAVEP